MVAPTRTPQARGRKCDLCKKILTSATWLDQTKPAKALGEAQNVLLMINQHTTSACPCIPKSIENLLVGSTHFEIHRLLARNLDSSVEAKQYETFASPKQKTSGNNEQKLILNDCKERKESRFKLHPAYSQHVDLSNEQLKHLFQTIDYWRLAMEDQAHPFDSRLALRLGLTHHVIYACYLFKYHKILDYQLITANLLLNVFRSIEGVTTNAILHAYFLLTKSLVDCDKLQLARHYLKQAMKLSNYQDKSNYESMLVDCVACELSFREGHREEAQNLLDELSQMISIKADDKLQHYYSRVMAMTIIIRYIHYYPAKSDQCQEFFHTFRYICAMIRRCYESPFELMMRKGTDRETSVVSGSAHILDHSWIRFAICDFVFESFDLLSEFYSRAGLPECLELIYNGLNLVSHRNGCVYWQSRILSIGARLDLLCDKYADAQAKLDLIPRIAGNTDSSALMTVSRLNSEVGLLRLIVQQNSIISRDVIESLIDRIKASRALSIERVHGLELYDIRSGSFLKVTGSPRVETSSGMIVLGGLLGKMSLTALNVGVVSSLRADNYSDATTAMGYVKLLAELFDSSSNHCLEYYDCQMILEILIHFVNPDNSNIMLLDAIETSHLFMKSDKDRLLDIQSQFSSLTLQSGDSIKNGTKCDKSRNNNSKYKKDSKIVTSRRSKRKGTYEVAIRADEDLISINSTRIYDVIETVTNFASLSNEDIVTSYLRNSEPNPDYSLYRRAHELMLAFRLSDSHYEHESILYHISESTTANTMRYRWMMAEEQSTSPFDLHTQHKTKSSPENSVTPSFLKHLGFCNILTNLDNTIKSMTRTIPEDVKVIQMKYLFDKRTDIEYLICACINNGGSQERVYLQLSRSLISDDFYRDASILLQHERDPSSLTISGRLASKIDESRNFLMTRSNSKTARQETRQQIETELSGVLADIEKDWFGPFRFLLCGKICDPNYSSLIQRLTTDLATQMSKSNRRCRSMSALRMFLENAPILSRDEFCQVLATLFECDPSAEEPREFFKSWLKSFELHLTDIGTNVDKITYLRQLQRGQVGLILDNELEMIPFESLQVVRVSGQGLFRVPSLRLFHIMSTRRCSPIKIDSNDAAYMLDPARNLDRTRERFDHKLGAQSDWCGTIGHPPTTEDLEKWLTSKQLYIFIGHGAGMAYYNTMSKSRGLSALPHIECASIVMGCSSGRMMAEGPRLETFGVGWMFVFKGSPCYMGLLWDVTDSDIDKFLDSLLDKWLPKTRKWSSCSLDLQQQTIPLTDASTRARTACQLKYLVGAAPVVYGLPIWCRET